MALAAFALARKHERKFKNEIQPEKPVKTSLDSK
jgi:hypothetical protein